MNVKTLTGYVLLALAAIILAAAAILLITNMDNDWRMKIFWRDYMLHRATALLLAAGGGILVYFTLRKILPAGIGSLRRGRAAKRAKEMTQRLDDLEKSDEKSDP